MKKLLALGLTLAGGLMALPADADAAIRRVPARYNMVSFSAGFSQPIGDYDAIGPVPLLADGFPIEIDGDDLFKDNWHLGFSYGSLWNRHVVFSLGFLYTRCNVNEDIIVDGDDLNVNQYDLNINLDLYPIDLTEYPFSPYVGGAFRTGFTSVGWDGYDTESELNVSAAVNFGADFKLFSSPDGRSFMTVASVNSYEFAGSDDRPRHLNLGGALRFWFR